MENIGSWNVRSNWKTPKPSIQTPTGCGSSSRIFSKPNSLFPSNFSQIKAWQRLKFSSDYLNKYSIRKIIWKPWTGSKFEFGWLSAGNHIAQKINHGFFYRDCAELSQSRNLRDFWFFFCFRFFEVYLTSLRQTKITSQFPNLPSS